jgi:hypothetical protein
MQDAELDYNEALWNKFDELATSQSKSSHNISNYIPNINFSISRSIIVPILFIVLIGGLSAMLFSFVDFKKKESIKKEIPLIAKSEKIKEPVIIAKEVIKPKKTVHIVTKPTPIVKVNLVPVAKTPEIKKEEPVKVAEVKPKEIIPAVIVRKKENTVKPEKKKRKKRLTPQELPIINTSTNLNDGAGEPELELDLK